jgi:dienelactone hydrolase
MTRATCFTAAVAGLAAALQLGGCGGSDRSAQAQPPVPITVSIAPDSASVPAGTTQVLTATVQNDSTQMGVTWTIAPASGGGTLSNVTSASVTYNAPASPPPSDLAVTITATSVSSKSISGSATLTVPASVVSVSPNTATVPAGGTQVLTATVQYDPGQTGVSWTISPASGVGTLSNVTSTSVTYNAPAGAPPSNLTATVTATSLTNGAVSASASITVPVIMVSVAPNSALIPTKAAQVFKAAVTNDPANGGVTWALSQGAAACPSACGMVMPVDASTATYVAPAAAPTIPVTLAATSVTDTTKSGTASITVSTGTVQLAPAKLDFGSIRKATSKTLHVVLTNAGAAPLEIGGMTITGANPNSFSQSNNCGSSVAAAASCDIAVTFKAGVGSVSAMLVIADSSSDSPQQIPLLGVGVKTRMAMAAVRSALVGVKTVTVPAPTGLDRVGTRVLYLTDASRDDPYQASGAKRELLVRFWYPALVNGDCKPAPYTDPAVWSYLSELVGVTLPAVRTNSCWEAHVLNGAYPVVVFTHGYTATFTDYTFLFEELASRGYIVASIDHTYEATAVAFPDGRLVKSVLGTYLKETGRADEPALLSAASVRLSDVRFVVGELARLNAQSEGSFAGHLDGASIAVAGHSLGGLTALQAVQQDPGIRAAVSIDGVVVDTAFGGTDKPVLILDAGRAQWSDDERRQWARMQGLRFAVNLTGAEHVTPTDAVWLAPGAIRTGSMSPAESVAAVREYIAAFLDASLQGRPTDALLTRRSLKYPDADVGGP